MPTSQSRTRTLLALCLGWGLGAPASAETTEFEYREAWGYAVVVPVQIHDVGRFEFVLDTGTDVTVVRDDLARRLGLVPTSRVELVTVAGQRLVAQARLSGLQLGTVRLGPMDVLIHEMAAARAAEPRLAGILGRNALAEVSLTIDHARRRVVLGGPPVGSSVAHEDVDGRPVIDARLGCAGETFRLALDSGAARLLLFGGARPLPVVTRAEVRAQTHSGTAMLRAGRLDTLCVGPARLRDVPVAVDDRRVAGPRREDGLLPTRLFARVHLDPRRRQVRLEPW